MTLLSSDPSASHDVEAARQHLAMAAGRLVVLAVSKQPHNYTEVMGPAVDALIAAVRAEAAAPDLYEALKDALELLEGVEWLDPEDQALATDALEKANTVIAKAEGR